jgi:hypothetical protein
MMNQLDPCKEDEEGNENSNYNTEDPELVSPSSLFPLPRAANDMK